MNQDLSSFNLPADFGPQHPDWNMPSKRTRYRLYQGFIRKKVILGPEPRYAIVTAVSGPKQWYAPLFCYCAMKAYPECVIKVCVRDELLQVGEFVDLAEDYLSCAELVPQADVPVTGLHTAAMRFIVDCSPLVADGKRLDGILITDIDILLQREPITFWEQHLDAMEKWELSCYNDYVVDNRMPGVLFVKNPEWWERTLAARVNEIEKLKTAKPYPGYDEEMLLRIVKTSGLPMQSQEPYLWHEHGIHLGRYRDRLLPMDAMHSTFIEELKRDAKFVRIAKWCAANDPEIGVILHRIGFDLEEE